ncbi:RluA family pseudouridine synthase [Brassicibacter mesophilus]|uniref:RluA family pseudouridine synthase n=1 Tax=Brassicibacter mesophilus TaxID=745119 RepID=UPI003D1A0256
MKNIIENESVLLFKVNSSNHTIEEILTQTYDISGRLLRKLQRSKLIFLNGKKAKGNSITKDGDVISIIMEDEEENNTPQNIPIDIIYEDYDLIILNKQPNIVVHPTKSHSEGTIANGVAFYFKQKNINKKVRFVNRLDMDTSGVLVIAKNSFAHQQMSIQFENNNIEKKYYAVVEGVVKDDEGIIEEAIGKLDSEPMLRSVTKDGKGALTKYLVLDRYDDATLLEVQIETGRTHQIRVHLKHIGHPIIGDSLYNNPSHMINRQALHSYSLKFNQPRTGRRIEVKAEPSEDIKLLISRLKYNVED